MHSQRRNHTAYLALLLSLSLAAACGDDHDDDHNHGTEDLFPIMVASEGDLEVSMYSDFETLSVGRNVVWYEVMLGGEPVVDATIAQTPIMQMMDFAHTCPENDPGAADADGLYQGMIAFIMPSGGMGTWSNTVAVTLNGESTAQEVVFEDLTIDASPRRKSFTWQENEMDVTGFVTLNPAGPWTTGTNDYVMTVHKRENLLSFPALEDITVDVMVTPEGGSGVAATAPTAAAGGEHMGSIDLPGAGTYAIAVTITQSGTELGTLTWDETIASP